jgi:PAS domain S-box-containing protein
LSQPHLPRVALFGPAAQALADALAQAGFQIAEGGAAVVDLLAQGALQAARKAHAPIVGLAGEPHESGTEAGVDAIVRTLHASSDLPTLLRALVRAQEDRAELLRQGEDLAALAELLGSLTSAGDPEPLLAKVVSRISRRLSAERASLVLLQPDGTGLVVAASDQGAGPGRQIDLANYPEIREVLTTGRPLVIDDARSHPLLDPVRAQIEGAQITAMAVVPLASEGEVVGVLFIRSRTRAGFTAREVGYLATAASAAAVSLRNAGRIQHEHRQRVAAERELSQLRRYEEFFSHVNDGMAVLDERGLVLTLNPAGCAVLGVQPEAVRGLPFSDLVSPESAMEAGLLLRELSRGGRVLSADLRVYTRDGRRLTLSVSAGPLRSQHGHAILTFRDVSERRDLEAELRKTKEFLERLIDATSDGIVAADLKGNILLFNGGAERMTGFTAAEIVGQAHVRDLYPPDQAREIMQRLRSGRDTSAFRGEIIAKSGEVVPVELSVALVAESGEETATVGVFRDLREELRVESELRKTRERLEEAEKAALVSELAGAAAHELNQPLTSVVGFSELLFRRTQENEKGREELAAILREAERMASIVRKIGKITRYETTPYVGKTRIVDLDRSSAPPPPVVIRDKP